MALFMDSDGGIDYDAAYDAQIPDGDDCFGMDAFNRALDYKFKQELRKFERASRRKKLPGTGSLCTSATPGCPHLLQPYTVLLMTMERDSQPVCCRLHRLRPSMYNTSNHIMCVGGKPLQ